MESGGGHPIGTGKVCMADRHALHFPRRSTGLGSSHRNGSSSSSLSAVLSVLRPALIDSALLAPCSGQWLLVAGLQPQLVQLLSVAQLAATSKAHSPPQA